jgi:crossover junction endodeoxyribonuclease RuvC
MLVLSIDPGYERLGIAIIEKDQKENLIFSECFKTSSELPHSERLGLIKNRIDEIINKFKLEHLAIETLFFSNNQKTALLVSEVRGLIIGVCQSAGLKVYEYGPGEIKVAVTGYGKSDKAAVIKMIPQLIKIEEAKLSQMKYDDEFDAVAVGLTHCAQVRF